MSILFSRIITKNIIYANRELKEVVEVILLRVFQKDF